MTKKQPAIKGLTVDTAGAVPTLYLYDEIGPGWLGMIDAQGVVDALAELSSAAEINVRINSPGGDVFEAAAIYNGLVRHPANVIVSIDGLAASAASVIAMAGNEVQMAANALLMIHRAWTLAWGNSEDLAEVIKTLDKVDQTITDTYAARTGERSSRDQIVAWMQAETWMDAGEALERGFVDRVTELQAGMAAAVPAGRYRNVPRGVRVEHERHSDGRPKKPSQRANRQSAGRIAPAIAARLRDVRRRFGE